MKDIPLLISNPTNIRYLTGFVGVAPEEREVYVLITKNETYLFTNSLYLENARKLNDLTIVEISRENPISRELAKIAAELKIKKLGFEEVNLTVSEYNKLKEELSEVKLIPTKNRIEELRMIKREDEVQNIRQAAKLTDQCFDFILGKLKPGITEAEFAWKIESFFRKKGASIAFSPIVAFGKNSSQPHYRPGSDLRKPQGQTLSKTDIVLLDFGARVNGYCADMTRVVFLGHPKDEWAKAYDVVLKAQQKALDLLKEGVRSGATLDAAAKEVIAETHLPPYPHSLGHNVGLAIHEGPRLTVKKDETLKPGMIFTIEPGVYIEGQYGIRIEDLVLLKKTGIEMLSQKAKEMIIL